MNLKKREEIITKLQKKKENPETVKILLNLYIEEKFNPKNFPKHRIYYKIFNKDKIKPS